MNRLFAGPGEMRARCRTHDWAATPLGAAEEWPASLRTAVDVCLASPFPMCVWWGRELVLVYNDRYPEILGTAKHPWALGRPAREVWAESWDQVAPQVAHVMSGAAIRREDQPYLLQRDGRETDAFFTDALSPVRDDAGAIAGVLHLLTETTPHVRSLAAERAARNEVERAREQAQAAESAERLAREHLERVIVQAPVAMYIARGRDHVFEVVNPAWFRITNKRPEEVVGRRVRDVFPELVPQGIVAMIERVFDTGEPFIMPAMPTVLDIDGDGVPEEHFFNVVYQPLRDADDAVYAIALVATEVTELAQARRRAEQLLAVADTASRAKSEFLAVMSHELRTPLNAIGGYAELIELGVYGPVTDAQRVALTRIQASERHLLGLIARVLEYARVGAGAVSYRLADVSLEEVVVEAQGLVAPQLRAKGLVYASSGVGPDVLVRADREKLQQILLNLLGNAVKFTHPREGAAGRIEVTCTEDRHEPGDPGPGRVRLHVRDTGSGIDPEDLQRVFEPFVQVDQGLTRRHDGVGLGLAISRDLARGMGGDLTVESTPGMGSVFTLTLLRA